jgi:uncharacterized protein (DUF952 family)
MAALIYKICTRAEWEAAVSQGAYRGSPVDLRDGFIHFSQEHQVAETLSRHFAGQRDLVRVSIDPAALGPSLRYEPSRGGELFPHLYGPLPVSLVNEVVPLG